MSAILVTGGAGYVGSHAAAALIDAGHEVVVLDDLSKGHRAAVPHGAELVVANCLDQDALAAVLSARSFEAVMHFAALSLVGESVANPWRYFRENVGGALNLIEASVGAGVKKFVLSSTANLFGEPQRVPIDEMEPLVPGSPYGESKFIIERMLHWADSIHGMRSACLRYFNAAGACPSGTRGEDHTPETHLIPLVLEVALGQRDEITIFGDDYDTPDGTCLRDYVHVCDLADAHVLALPALDTESLRLNLGNGTGYSVREVIETARRVTGHPIPAVMGERRPGDPAALVASSDAIRARLGWEPRFATLEVIIETAWRWHQAHPNGYAGS